MGCFADFSADAVVRDGGGVNHQCAAIGHADSGDYAFVRSEDFLRDADLRSVSALDGEYDETVCGAFVRQFTHNDMTR